MQTYAHLLMAEKKELLQFRISPDLKREFFEVAKLQGISPSGLLRNMMQKVVDRRDAKIEAAEENIRSIHLILLELLKYAQKSAFLAHDESEWEDYRSTVLPNYLDEMIGQTIRDSGITGDEYNRHYWREVDKAWFTNFSNAPPFIAMHLNPDTMNEIREEIKKK